MIAHKQPVAVSDRQWLSLRSVKFFFLWLLVWQDNMVEGSIFQIYTYTGRFHSVRPSEQILFVVLFLFIIDRLLKREYTLRRSYFYGPLALMLLALFVSWARGSYELQAFRMPFEVHEGFLLPWSFLLFLNLFKDDSDRRHLFYILILGTIPKAIEGLYIKFFSSDPQVSWGVLQMWRDGMLLALGVVSLVLLQHFKSHPTLAKLRKAFMWSIPFLFATLILSYRRSFFLASFVAVFSLFLFLDGKQRKHHLKLLFQLLLLIVLAILLTEPVGFIARIAGIFTPQQEGSAYIRLMELPNVLLNIRDNPLFGKPIGVLWDEYYRMPIYAIFTRFGVHNTYLYWPLRTGVIGTVAFWWLLWRIWKSSLICWRVASDERDKFVGLLAIMTIVIYQTGCFFGMMYGDAVTILMAIYLAALQLQIRGLTGHVSLSHVRLIQTLRQGRIIYRNKLDLLPARGVSTA